ncbi:NUDIX hydrolase [Actinoallomurus sp. NPDC052274]|uniref:NUDIX hydrolase n=1 Tax=Actinoallomurus sp. NPDC052274 TaxID=3155420 RepID=UPI003444D3FE
MTPDAAAKYFWHEAPVAEGLEITQVYGYLICPRTGRVLVQDDEGTFNLPGGTPESFDADLVDTLVREAFEENQVVVSDAVYLGYQDPPVAPRAVRPGPDGRADRCVRTAPT